MGSAVRARPRIAWHVVRLALAALVLASPACELGSVSPASGDGDGAPAGAGEFGYPVGDQVTYPAGGWAVVQVLSHYLSGWGGRHLAVDVSPTGGGEAAIGAPVHAVGDGEVLFAGPNSSTYKNVVLIRHTLDDGSTICSFYGHVTEPTVATGDQVTRGQTITTVIDWAIAGGGSSSNSHLHYVMLSAELCAASAAANGSLICGYDDGGENGVESLDSEPYRYTSAGDPCGTEAYGEAFISPTQFIADRLASP